MSPILFSLLSIFNKFNNILLFKSINLNKKKVQFFLFGYGITKQGKLDVDLIVNQKSNFFCLVME
ncbi:MAG: hypothetical protein Satyrvirus25_3 [Satyrvirus sp.]|uniref:Uncharacterized protein n=1 Tax=Satyrvirus sp. TaxID=2487771 RepID=A0A3G5AEN8_9VIRU|nr:MAG: hypothetical protein Satyrvirus25_3 [Satyrvirus sp.]